MADKTAEKTAGSIRARVRAEMIEQIKAAARRQIATEGASLSLRAVARELGMVSSALYRYFASRDDLLTALIIDAYNSLGEVSEKADARIADREDVFARWLAVTKSLRAWALNFPHEYALIYGSPVPGYAAPRDTVGPSLRPVVVLGAILCDAQAVGRLKPAPIPTPDLPGPLAAEIRTIAESVAPEISESAMALGLIAWTELFGAINFELFGRFNNAIDERAAWYDHQTQAMAAFIGLGPPVE
jgi:AcrR family transcriptional regulator